MPTVHMICGPVGAGKTTYGRRLARERGAVLFVLDEWMATLFAPDAPQPLSLAWALPRVERCIAQIWSTCRSVLAAERDVVVELGFLRRDERDRFRALAAEAPILLHHVIADREVRRARVRARNQGGDTLSVEVDDPMFDWAESYFEPLAPDELRGAVVVDTGNAAPT